MTGGRALPSGPFEAGHRSLQSGLRAWVERQTRHPLGYVEQLHLRQFGHLVKIEVEVETLSDLEEALGAGVDAVLLDNMSLDDLRRAVAMIGGRAISEASGRVSLETAAVIAETSVDFISVGWLTHSAPILDIGLDYAA